MMYSCALWDGDDDGGVRGDIERHDSDVYALERAQQRKIAYILSKARVQAGDHILEIGSGWGALAISVCHSFMLNCVSAISRILGSQDGMHCGDGYFVFPAKAYGRSKSQGGRCGKISTCTPDGLSPASQLLRRVIWCIHKLRDDRGLLSSSHSNHCSRWIYIMIKGRWTRPPQYLLQDDWLGFKEKERNSGNHCNIATWVQIFHVSVSPIKSDASVTGKLIFYRSNCFARHYHWPNTFLPSATALPGWVQSATPGRLVLVNLEDHNMRMYENINWLSSI